MLFPLKKIELNLNEMNSDKGPSADKLQALETAPNIYLILSPDLYILTASDVFLEATETTRQAIVGKHIFEAFPDNPAVPGIDGEQSINFSLQEALRTKKRHQLPVIRYDVPDHDIPGQFIQRYWHPSHTPVLNEQGKVEYIIQLANNVTEQVLAEIGLEETKVQQQQIQESFNKLNEEIETRVYVRTEELAASNERLEATNHEQRTLYQQLLKAQRESEESRRKAEASERELRLLADLVPAKISNALPSGEVIYFNRQWLDYSRLSFEELRDFGYHNMMHPDEIEEFQARLAEAARMGVPLEMEMRFQDAQGKYRWHLNIASPVLNENGEISMWVGSTTDIQRIKEEEQRKTDFIGMVSHELKTPLTLLNAYLQMLLRKAQNTADTFASGALDKSVNQVRKMTKMINGFLDVSRLESGKMHIDKHLFDLAELIREVEEESTAAINSHQMVFAQGLNISLVADRDKIGEVIHNFIGNAVKYSPAGTTIRITCLTVNNTFQMCVRDEGPGIKPEDQLRLFERYYRAEDLHTKNVAGFGIGLYLSAEIIHRHQGEIWVESQVGKGSSFYFSLPLER